MEETQYGPLLEIQEIKAAGGGGFEVSGYCSTFGNVDHGGDVVMRGAFDDTLGAKSPIRFLYAHRTDQVLGLPLDLKSDDKGLFGRFKISKTQLGNDVHTLLQDKALDSFSIGYVPTDVEYDDVGNRLIKSVDLLEVSIVALPMNDRATVTHVKADDDESKAVWSGSFINDLPDSAFAVILPGGKRDSDGKTAPRSLRKLPHHGSDGKVDMPHLRNALSREPQTDMPAGSHATAKAHLNRHAKAEGVGKEWGELDEDVPFEDLLAQIKGYLIVGCDEAEALAARRSEIGRKLAEGHHEAIDSLKREAEASAERLGLLLVESAAAKAKGDLQLRLELARRFAQYRARSD